MLDSLRLLGSGSIHTCLSSHPAKPQARMGTYREPLPLPSLLPAPLFLKDQKIFCRFPHPTGSQTQRHTDGWGPRETAALGVIFLQSGEDLDF